MGGEVCTPSPSSLLTGNENYSGMRKSYQI